VQLRCTSKATLAQDVALHAFLARLCLSYAGQAIENHCQEKQKTHTAWPQGSSRGSVITNSWRIVEDCNEQQFHGLPISLEQQCAATTLTDFVDATSRIGRPVWQALDYRLADHGGAEGTKMDQIRKDPGHQ